jgi:hypothetical protein
MVKYLIKIPQKPLLPDITVWHVTEGDQEWLELSAGQHYWTWDSIDEFLDEVAAGICDENNYPHAHGGFCVNWRPTTDPGAES